MDFDTSEDEHYGDALADLENSDASDDEDEDTLTFLRTRALQPSLCPGLTEEEIELIAALEILEQAAEIRQSYPPRFSQHGTTDYTYSSERDILSELVVLDKASMETQYPDHDIDTEDTYLEFEITNFCIYQTPQIREGIRHRRGFAGRYEYLNVVSNSFTKEQQKAAEQQKTAKQQKARQKRSDVKSSWRTDGTLVHDTIQQHFLRGHVVQVTIGELEDLTQHTAAGSIHVMTSEGARKNYWYRLKSPSPEYRTYWLDFVWLADFVKFYIDFLFVNTTEGTLVCLDDFRLRFWTWLSQLHGDKISDWHQVCARQTDFRQYVLTYCEFLRNQTWNVQKSYENKRFLHPVWNEIGGHILHDRIAPPKERKTVVTRHIATSFLKSFPWWQKKHHLLDIVDACPSVEVFTQLRRQQLQFPHKLMHSQTDHFQRNITKAALVLEDIATKNRPVHIENNQSLLDQVVVVRIPNRRDDSFVFRYAWVHMVTSMTVSVNWLVLPNDTLCGEGDGRIFYPIGNELFLSDECSCRPITIRNIIGIVKVSMFAECAGEDCDLFVHSRYNKAEQTHTTAYRTQSIPKCLQHSAKVDTAPKQRQAETTYYSPPMKLCALCSSCGLLEHALCEGSGAQTVLAVEYDEAAARSHRANNPTQECEYHINSVNHVLRSYRTGQKPLPLVFDCIVAGCPCQGFSLLNQSRDIDDWQSQKNCSILANILSWVETFLPAYVLIENVPNMDGSTERIPSACAQAICCLVALGYQVRKSIKVDSDVGGFSKRTRLFIIAAAPGMVLPAEIPERHYRSDHKMSKLQLAKSPLVKPRTAWEAIRDLPPISNESILNHVDPEHVPLDRFKIDWRRNISFRNLVTKIGTTLVNAYHTGKLSDVEQRFFDCLNKEQQKSNSKYLKRIDMDKPFRTIATSLNFQDARFGGDTVHPYQDRLLSLREIYRAQGVPDNFLLAGNLGERYHQLGNGVPWALGKGWGIQFGKAWARTMQRSSKQPAPASSSISTSIDHREDTRSPAAPSSASSLHTPTRQISLRPHSPFDTTRSTITVRPARRPRRVVSDDSDSESEPAHSMTHPENKLFDTTKTQRPDINVISDDSGSGTMTPTRVKTTQSRTFVRGQRPVVSIKQEVRPTRNGKISTAAILGKRQAPEDSEKSSDDDEPIFLEVRAVKKAKE